jgi:ribose transport system substrate-binding protein
LLDPASVPLTLAEFNALPPAPACTGTKGTIGLADATLSAPFFEGIRQGVEDMAARLCYTVIFQSADDGATQTNQVQVMLAQKIQALIYIPSGADAASVPVTDANAANVPVIAVDRYATTGKYVTFIAADSVPGAAKICDYLAQGIGGKGDILVIQGQIGTTPYLARTQGCNQALANYPNIHIVGQAPANWDRTQGYNVSSDLLQAHPSAVGIFGMSDDMAIGAAQAAAAAGKTEFIVGFDGLPDALQAIKDGKQQATMLQPCFHFGMLAVVDAVLTIQGQAAGIPAQQLTMPILVNQANVDQYLNKGYYGTLG